eukprot:scaffold10881_cov130-Isochrysis_galbana.AAC.1
MLWRCLAVMGMAVTHLNTGSTAAVQVAQNGRRNALAVGLSALLPVSSAMAVDPAQPEPTNESSTAGRRRYQFRCDDLGHTPGGDGCLAPARYMGQSARYASGKPDPAKRAVEAANARRNACLKAGVPAACP